MNSKSIKVGDWVQIAHTAAKVVSVEIGCCVVEHDGMTFKEAYTNIEGIPITKDILDLNGFVYDMKKGEFTYLGEEQVEDEDFPDVKLTYRKPFLERRHHFKVSLFGNWVADIVFVHEYQHILWALRHIDNIQLP